MNPVDAIKAHKDLKTKISIAMHDETFALSALDYKEAETTLYNNLKNNPGIDFRTLSSR